MHPSLRGIAGWGNIRSSYMQPAVARLRMERLVKFSHGRPHLRLPGYDYSSEGGYFLTISTADGECTFGHVVGEEMLLNEYGRIVEEEWLKSAELRSELHLGEFVVMPNHLHGIVLIIQPDGRTNCRLHVRASAPRRPRSISSFVAGFKAVVTRRINILRSTPDRKVWHDNFFDRIIRDEKMCFAIAKYIQENPKKWALDHENPEKRNRR
jgi:putative transposase